MERSAGNATVKEMRFGTTAANCNFRPESNLGPFVQKPINGNPRLKNNQGVYFSTPKCCSKLIFGKALHLKKSTLKNKNQQKKLSPKSWKHETKIYANPGLSYSAFEQPGPGIQL